MGNQLPLPPAPKFLDPVIYYLPNSLKPDSRRLKEIVERHRIRVAEASKHQQNLEIEIRQTELKLRGARQAQLPSIQIVSLLQGIATKNRTYAAIAGELKAHCTIIQIAEKQLSGNIFLQDLQLLAKIMQRRTDGLQSSYEMASMDEISTQMSLNIEQQQDVASLLEEHMEYLDQALNLPTGGPGSTSVGSTEVITTLAAHYGVADCIQPGDLPVSSAVESSGSTGGVAVSRIPQIL